METTTIHETRRWSADAVRAMCIRHDLYSNGITDDYDRMLKEVTECSPSTSQIYLTAEDIYHHSSYGGTIEGIMYLLANEACWATFEIEED